VISCADFLAEVSNYVEGDVADELRAQLEFHLSHCHYCTVLVDSTRKTIRILTDADCFDLPQEVCSRIGRQVINRIQNHAEERNQDELSARDSS
jgi:hypothetical protein